jgi:membrane associated rhomboid family serine protease
MDDPGPPVTPDPTRPGRLSHDDAIALLAGGDAALAAGDAHEAAIRFGRVVGYEDAAVTAAALLGLGEARFRLGQDEAAVASWRAVLQVGETPSAYAAWRNLAAAEVRNGDLRSAIGAYREAERRAPPADRAEIANRLGWLTKETGDESAARRYFARGRGDSPLISVTTILIAATVIISLTAILSNEGRFLYDNFELDKAKVAAGEYWRLFTVTLLHGSPDAGFVFSFAHLFFNMYALYLAGPIVERWYGGLTFLAVYLACAAGGSVASFVFGGPQPSVGASGAIFGLFGLLLAANRVYRPVDRQGRYLIGQLGGLIVINILFGFAVRGIDNAAHLGGLATGLWLGALLQPTRVQTQASIWQRAGHSALGRLASVRWAIPIVAFGVVAIVVVAGLLVGTADRLA